MDSVHTTGTHKLFDRLKKDYVDMKDLGTKVMKTTIENYQETIDELIQIQYLFSLWVLFYLYFE